MQIRSTLRNHSSLPGPEFRRERVPMPVRDEGGGEQGTRAREVTRIARSPVAAAAEEELAGLAPHVRGALQSYLSNGPSLSERYGVELAGVDLFV